MGRLSQPLFYQQTCFFFLCGLWCALTFSQALVSICLIAAITAWAIHHWLLRKEQPLFLLPRHLLFFFGIYAACVLLSALGSEFPKESLQGLRKTFSYFIIMVMSFEMLRPAKALRKFYSVISFWAAFLALDAWIQYQFGFDLLRRIPPQDAMAGLRLSASFKTYGLFAAYLIIMIPILLGIGLSYRTNKKWGTWYLYFILGWIHLWLLYRTLSRGAILAFLLGIIVLLIAKRKWLWILALVGSCAFASWKILPKSYTLHLNHEFQEQSLVERYYLWDRALHVIRAKPWIGTGINTYAKAHAAYDKTQNWRVRNYYAHNGYLQTASEIGLPGLAAFLVFLAAVILEIQKRIQLIAAPERFILGGILLAIINFLLFTIADTVLHNLTSATMFWFILGLGLAMHPSPPVDSR